MFSKSCWDIYMIWHCPFYLNIEKYIKKIYITKTTILIKFWEEFSLASPFSRIHSANWSLEEFKFSKIGKLKYFPFNTYLFSLVHLFYSLYNATQGGLGCKMLLIRSVFYIQISFSTNFMQQSELSVTQCTQSPFSKLQNIQKQSQQSLHLELLFDDQKYMKFIDCSDQVLIKTNIGNEYISTWWIYSTCILASVEMLNIKYYVVF